MSKPNKPLSRLLKFDSLKSGETEVQIIATSEEKKSLAVTFNLQSIEKFISNLKACIWQGIGVSVTGEINAEITQECVVTLEPINKSINAEFQVKLVPSNQVDNFQKNTDDKIAIEIEIDEIEPPDVFDGSTLDLGEIASEQFALLIDPYPRAENADFKKFYSQFSNLGQSEPHQQSAFSVLSKLNVKN